MMVFSFECSVCLELFLKNLTIDGMPFLVFRCASSKNMSSEGMTCRITRFKDGGSLSNYITIFFNGRNLKSTYISSFICMFSI
jgi:hypothetical protein